MPLEEGIGMTLPMVVGFKIYNKKISRYFAWILFTAFFLTFAIASLPVAAKDVKFDKSKRNDPDVIATARKCRSAEEAAGSDPDDAEDIPKNLRDSYNKCVSFGYCNIVDPGSYSLDGPAACQNAFSLITAQDCVKYQDKAIYFDNERGSHKVDYYTRRACVTSNYCSVEWKGSTKIHNCKAAKEKIAEEKKSKATPKKGSTPDANTLDNYKRSILLLICNDGNRPDNVTINDCKDKLSPKIDQCIKDLTKNKSTATKIDETSIYACVVKDQKLKGSLGLPDKLNLNANAGQNFNNISSVDDSDQKKCSDNAGFFGFFWCPGINMLTEVFDTITGMITGGLKWTILVDTRASSEHVNKDPHRIIYNTWSSVLSVANIVMIIGFIAILYSYALNSNNVAKAYNVKTLMSRLIIVAIATNFSFYICAALADLSNIAGVGIYDLIRDTIPGNGDGPFSISGLGTAISVVVGATILIVLAYMSLHLVILSLIIILALITLRQIALLMLVIVSPLAFACYLFPNTAKWFTKWWNYYIQLLIVFPLFTAVWASSRLVASVLELTHQSNLITTVLSAVTPLLAIIPIFKMSGGLMSKMTNGLQKRASKWEGRDNLRRKRVSNFAKRNSMALQNKLGSVQLGDHGMGRILSGAAHLAGGGIGLVGGTLAAAANARASDNLDELSGQAVKDINKEYEEKQQKKADEKIEEFAKKNHSISDEMASTIEQTIDNNPVKYTKNKTGERSNPIITGAIAIKYMAMTGRGVDGKLLDQNTYRAALKYADEHIVMSNDEFNIAVYNVQQNGDKDTRSDFIKRHTDPDKSNHSIFMSKPGQNDFINQTGTFSKNRFESDDELANISAQERTQKSTSTRQAQINMQKSTLAGESLDYSRRQYISSLNSAGYNNLSDAARYKLARQTILRKDTASANRIQTLHARVHHDINIIKVNDNTKHNMEVIDKALRSFTDKHSGNGPNL